MDMIDWTFTIELFKLLSLFIINILEKELG